MGWRGAAAGMERSWEFGRSGPVGSAASCSGSSTSCTFSSARADLGCIARITRLAHHPVSPDVGRRAAATTTRAGSGAIVGRTRNRRATRTDLGLARTCAVAGRAASASIVGRAQTRIAGAPAAGAIVERKRGTRRARGRSVVGFGRNRVGRAPARVVGHPGKLGPQCPAERRAVMGGAGRAIVGGAQGGGACRTACAFMVGAIGAGVAPSSCARAIAGRTSLVAAGRGRSAGCPIVVAASRVRAVAAVSRAARRCACRRTRRGSAAGRRAAAASSTTLGVTGSFRTTRPSPGCRS
jgi:hypothetical protein